jgi:hypothetical protein
VRFDMNSSRSRLASPSRLDAFEGGDLDRRESTVSFIKREIFPGYSLDLKVASITGIQTGGQCGPCVGLCLGHHLIDHVEQSVSETLQN